MSDINVGDLVKSDLDGITYTVIRYGPRDKIDPLPGVRQIGNIIIGEDYLQNRVMLFEWEVEKV